ncbi:MAG TPA: alkane 1-monooxygenase [Candidatus Marinimicrobia bacterium]|jgi:alkane 1-monooxygenase|nr:alkane 1-monooxygenase [Candidatus Neomarinimicrobiota bacterium]|tara:strand:+ start:2686 stop:3795 length:1110 start_codon:yes stop_codon:yes gene_type:complete
MKQEMTKYTKYYIVPVLLLSVLLGIFLGGHWMWLGLTVLFVVVIGGDAVLGEDASQPEYSHPWLIELPLHLALPLIIILLLSFAWVTGSAKEDFLGIGKLLSGLFTYDFLAARNGSVWSDYVGAVLGVGFMVAGYGTNVGHELTHRIKDRVAMLEGRWLLSASCNADFAIEHVYGHHVTVGTNEDPATARKGENVYAFAIRSTVFGHISAWKHELQRLRKKGFNPFSFKNRMITGYIMSLLLGYLFFYAGGWFGVILFLGQALFAKFILEIVNYMEHYGLVRSTGQQIGPEHSWNTNKKMSTMVLFSLTRHSAHHEKPRVKFWKLDPYADAPQMPYGYLTTLVICLIPPLWYRIIDPDLTEWEKQYATI